MRLIAIGCGDQSASIPWDVFVCASGYESRATSFPRQWQGVARRRIAIGFSEYRENAVRQENDKWYVQHGFELPLASGHEEGEVDALFDGVLKSLTGQARVLMDISSMTRSWYGAWIRAVRERVEPSELTTLFAYVPSLFRRRPHFYPQNSFVGPAKGFCGLALPNRPTVLIVGLGQDEGRAIGLKEELDPSIAAAFLAKPAGDPKFERAAYKANQEYLRGMAPDLLFEYPLRDFVTAFHRLRAVTRVFGREGAPILAPLGPKIFGLTCFLVAAVEPQTSVWRVSAGPREGSDDRKGVGVPIFAEVRWSSEPGKPNRLKSLA